jgi:hypothetical protein
LTSKHAQIGAPHYGPASQFLAAEAAKIQKLAAEREDIEIEVIIPSAYA